MITPFDQIDAESLSKVLSSPPFLTVDGVANIREVGGFTITGVSALVKPGYYFRAGELSHITDKGKEQLRSFGIRKVFDSRAPHEVARFEAPSPSIEGVEFTMASVSNDGEFDPISIAKV